MLFYLITLHPIWGGLFMPWFFPICNIHTKYIKKEVEHSYYTYN